MIPAPMNILVSFHYFGRYNLDRFAGLRIIGDSGAYSARMQGVEIHTPELAAWAKQWQHRLAWVAALDVAGDTATTRRNWHEMVDEHGVPAVSSLHVGTPPAEMDYYAERGVDFLGLGGMAGGTSSPDIQFRWLVQVFKYAQTNHPNMRFHGWGITNQKMIRLPFYSVDSSGWGSGYRYGRLNLRDPNSRKTHAIALNGRETYTPEIACLLRDHYGVNPSEVAKSEPANRPLMVRLSALSASVQEQRFRHLHRHTPITAPTWGQLPGAQVGPHQHLALNAKGQEYENDTIVELAAGPHMHLAEGHPEHLAVVADMQEK